MLLRVQYLIKTNLFCLILTTTVFNKRFNYLKKSYSRYTYGKAVLGSVQVNLAVLDDAGKAERFSTSIHTVRVRTTYTIPYYAIPYHTMPCHAMPCHAIPYLTIPYDTIPYQTIPKHTMPCHAMPCLISAKFQVTP